MNNVTFLSGLYSLLAADATFTTVANLVKDFLDAWWGPIMIALGACSGILGLFVGIRLISAYASAEESKIKNAKTMTFGVLLGIAVTFLLAVGAQVLVGALTNWSDNAMENISTIVDGLYAV